jgi:hypothetical protein
LDLEEAYVQKGFPRDLVHFNLWGFQFHGQNLLAFIVEALLPFHKVEDLPLPRRIDNIIDFPLYASSRLLKHKCDFEFHFAINCRNLWRNFNLFDIKKFDIFLS